MLHCSWFPNSGGGLIKHNVACPPGFRLWTWVGVRDCTHNHFPGAASAAGSRPTMWDPLFQSKWDGREVGDSLRVEGTHTHTHTHTLTSALCPWRVSPPPLHHLLVSSLYPPLTYAHGPGFAGGPPRTHVLCSSARTHLHLQPALFLPNTHFFS